MLAHLPKNKRRIIFVAMVFWAMGSIWSFATGQPQIFSALGSFSLCISFSVFLTDRYVSQETRRHWDSQILTQSRMMWRYFEDKEQGKEHNDPTPLNTLRDQITTNFDDLLEAKAAERKLERFRIELFFTITGTLQWGFGEIILTMIYG
ncbi:MAG: hypothetical protein JKY31_13000 [Rhodobacteraceae bacterium]|nr:hypothetical protein [Paracoccaceae bacterium]